MSRHLLDGSQSLGAFDVFFPSSQGPFWSLGDTCGRHWEKSTTPKTDSCLSARGISVSEPFELPRTSVTNLSISWTGDKMPALFQEVCSEQWRG